LNFNFLFTKLWFHTSSLQFKRYASLFCINPGNLFLLSYPPKTWPHPEVLLLIVLVTWAFSWDFMIEVTKTNSTCFVGSCIILSFFFPLKYVSKILLFSCLFFNVVVYDLQVIKQGIHSL
jgi:hypothetical protein